jgi:hypothetical protein
MSSYDNRLSRGKPRKRGRIDWTDQDREELAEKVFELLQQMPDKNLIWLINEAQKKLEWGPEQTRKITAFTQVTWLKNAIKQKFGQLKHQLFLLERKKTPTPPPPPPKVPTAKEVLAAASHAEIASILFGRLFGVLDRMEHTLNRIESNMPKKTYSASSTSQPEPEAPTKDAKPETRKFTVTVVGINSEQERKIKGEFDGLFKFKFYDGKSTHAQLPSCDYAFIMCHWSGRPWIDECRTARSRVNVHMVQQGGMGQLIDKMTEVLV